ncbi:MAG: F0F1 ATP synthase subunit epsilon, partial [Cytophagales bacterium]|nr:F0F1 ATP synthase subunit epsilon [Cytophaga sp.]
LKIILPSQVFAEIKDVKRMVVECLNGSYGFLPNMLECTATVVPGILMYESHSTGATYVAIDEGVVVKVGKEVYVSVKNAIGGNNI